MRSLSRRVNAAILTALAGIGLLVYSTGTRSVQAQPAAGDKPIEQVWVEAKLTYQDATSCKGCHTMATKDRIDRGAFEVSLLSEYAVWKVHDKHAQAYAVLEGARGKKIGELLKVNVTKPEAGCLSCHAMHIYNEYNKAAGGVGGLDMQDGVSCGGCHGPSSAWANSHDKKEDWRNKFDAKAKEEKGFRDLRDPVKRSELCMSCHIGNAREGKVVTHGMMAAGHPPLPPIEIATFSKNEPQHWRDPKDTPAFSNWQDVKFQQTRFALVGAVVAVRESLKLARDRASFNTPKPDLVFPELLAGRENPGVEKLRTEAESRWPEIAMAHSDCFACHHDLRFPGFRTERGFGYHVPGIGSARVAPGRPVIRSWPLASLKAAADYVNKPIKNLEEPLRLLASATSSRPFGTPAQIDDAVKAVNKWCDEIVAALLAKETRFDQASSKKLLANLCSLFDGDKSVIPDYETARQIGSMIATIADDLGLKDAIIDDKDSGLIKKLNLRPYSKQKVRAAILIDVVKSAGNVPANLTQAFDEGSKTFATYLDKVGDTKYLQDSVLGPNYQNQFLLTLQNAVSNKGFTDEIVKRASKLQEFSDEEQRDVLSAVANYDPRWFTARLKELKAKAQ